MDCQRFECIAAHDNIGIIAVVSKESGTWQQQDLSWIDQIAISDLGICPLYSGYGRAAAISNLAQSVTAGDKHAVCTTGCECCARRHKHGEQHCHNNK